MAPTRILNYSANVYSALQKNSAHQFAAQHALCIYPSSAIYSFIPKNACSTLRLSLAITNGCIESTKDFNWIHNNNATFSADLKSLLTARYTFTVLRCPYARLASVYLDKIVDRNVQAWQIIELTQREFDAEDLTFNAFVHLLKRSSVLKSNKHWRPQTDFLVYKHYDDYFCLEKFSTAANTLNEKIGLSVVDARPLTKHGIDGLNLISKGDFSDTPPAEIRLMKAMGQCPKPSTLYTNRLIEIVREKYKADLELYVSLFGPKNLMFPAA